MILCLGLLAVILLYVVIFARGIPKAITLEETKNQNDMAKTDFTYCRGIHCPSRNQCKRYVEGLEAAKETEKEHSWIQNCRHAKLFIHKDGNDT